MGQLNFKLLKRLQLLLLAVIIPQMANADRWGDCDFELDGLYYDIYQSNTVYVTSDREYDEDAEAYLNIPYNLSGELTIPSSITRNGTTYTVVGIDDYSFKGCTRITSINLPNTINSIGKQAFYGCSGITSINIPSSIKYLGTEAFKNCTKLESISFGSTDNLVSIGSYVFYNTKWWNEQPNGLAYLANNTIAYAYKGNASTNERITLDYNTKIIAGTAFANCSNLKYIGVPNSVQRIGQEAFAYCTNLDEIYIGTGIKTIGARAFMKCGYIKMLIRSTSKPQFYSSSEDEWEGAGVFYSTSPTLYVPSDLISIYQNEYFGCDNKPNFTISEIVDVSNIIIQSESTDVLVGEQLSLTATCKPDNASLNGVIWSSDNNYIATVDQNGVVTGLREGTVTIGARSTDYNYYKSIDITVSLPTVNIDDYTYKIDEANGIASVKANKEYSYTTDNTITSLSFANTVEYKGVVYPVTKIAKSGFSHCIGITELSIPNFIAEVENGAFSNCSFTKAMIPASVTHIGQQAFFNCSSLQEVIFEDCDNEILLDNNKYSDGYGGGLFENCPIATAYIGRNIVVSNYNDSYNRPYSNAPFSRWDANAECPITSVEIGTNVTQFCDFLFEDCKSISSFTSHIANPSIISLGTSVFRDIPTSTCTLHVPFGTTALYRNADQWSAFTNIVEMAPPTILATSVALDQTEAELTEGETLQLTATVLPDDATDKTVTWASSDENVATVENGVVTAVAEGTATITATTVDGSNLSASCALTVNRLIIPGDANGDNSIDATDYVATANYILGDIPEGFDISAIDFDNNGVIDVADLVGVTNMILNANATQPAPQYAGAIGLKEFDLNNHLYVESIAHSGVNTYTVSIALDNQDAFTALQADIYLPENVDLASDFILSDRKAKDHSITSQVQPDGAIRIFISSPGSKNLRESSGEIVSFQVQGNIPTALEIKRIIASTDQAVGFHLQDFNLQNVVTGIDSLLNSSNGTDDTYYNILGVPVENPTPGIYIKKGQKVIVK